MNDTVMQMASCTFDVHLQEVLGTLIVGGSLIMLRPNGNMDFRYAMNVMKEKQISYIQSVPAYLNRWLQLFEKEHPKELNKLRNLDIGGNYLLA